MDDDLIADELADTNIDLTDLRQELDELDELADTENIDLSGLQQDLSDLTDVDTLEFEEFNTVFTSETQAAENEAVAVSEPEISSWIQSLKNFPQSIYQNITSRFPTLRQPALENPSIEMTSEELPQLEETNFSETVLNDEGVEVQEGEIDVEVPEPEPTVEYEIDYSQEVDLDELLDDAFTGEPGEGIPQTGEIAEGDLVDVSGMTETEMDAAFEAELDAAFGETAGEIGAELSAETAEVAGQSALEVLEIASGEAAGIFGGEVAGAAAGGVLASVAGAAATVAPYVAPVVAVGMLVFSIYSIVELFEKQAEIEQENEEKIRSLKIKAAIKAASYDNITQYEDAMDTYYRYLIAYIKYTGPTVTGIDGPSLVEGQYIRIDSLVPALDKFLNKLAEKVKFYNDFNRTYVKWVMNKNPDEPDVTYREMPRVRLYKLLESKGDTIKDKMDNYLATFSLEGTKLFTVDSKVIDHWREQVFADKAYDNSNWSEYYTKNERKFKQMDTIMISRKKAEWKNIDKTLIPYVQKVETLRKFLNRTMQCYAVVFDTYFEPLEEEFTGDRFKRNMNKIGWCKDESVLLKIDNKLPDQFKFQHYTRKPSMYNGSWTQDNRITWEKMALKAAYDFIVETSANIATELNKKNKDTEREDLFADELYYATLPASLAYWAMVWTCKAYNDLTTPSFSDEFLEGYNIDKNSDEITFLNREGKGVFDFEVTKQEQRPRPDRHISFTTAYSRHQNILYVAFRGTDFNNTMENLMKNIGIDGAFGVHHMKGIMNYEWPIYYGFAAAWSLIREQFIDTIKDLTIIYNPKEVVYTGHSLGSALAQVAMLDKVASQYATCYIGFGTPRVIKGDEAKSIYKKYWRNKSWRICSKDDIVSYAPTPKLGFRNLGNGMIWDRDTEKFARFDGEYRNKTYFDYIKNAASSVLNIMEGHSRMAYINAMNNTQLFRPVSIPLITDLNQALDPTTLQYVYTRTCAYHAFVMDTKITKPDFVVNIIKFFNDFSMIDIDVNGNISREEWIKHKERLSRGRRLASGVPDFDLMDMDGDGLISFKEYVEAGLRKFQPSDVIPKPLPTPIIPSIPKFGSLPITGLVILPNRVTKSFIEGLVIL